MNWTYTNQRNYECAERVTQDLNITLKVEKIYLGSRPAIVGTTRLDVRTPQGTHTLNIPTESIDAVARALSPEALRELHSLHKHQREQHSTALLYKSLSSLLQSVYEARNKQN
jgi:hypothetical protein